MACTPRVDIFTVCGYSHLVFTLCWDSHLHPPCMNILTLHPPCMAILTSHPPCVDILTLHPSHMGARCTQGDFGDVYVELSPPQHKVTSCDHSHLTWAFYNLHTDKEGNSEKAYLMASRLGTSFLTVGRGLTKPSLLAIR